MSDPAEQDPYLATLKLAHEWLTAANRRIEDAIVREEMARAGLGEKRNNEQPLVDFPPCVICGAPVAMYTSELGHGPVLIEFQPCGHQVVHSDDRA